MVELNFEDGGSGRPILLLHGFPLDRTMWANQAVHLRSDYRVIVPDLRGFGQSPFPEDGFSVEAMAEDVLALADRLLPGQKLTLGGLSMGGYVALAVATKAPERLDALMLFNTKAEADTPEAAANRLEQAKAIEAEDSVEGFAATMVTRLFGKTTQAQKPNLIDAYRRVLADSSVVSVAGMLRGLAKRPDFTDKLAEIPMPTLVIAGEEDVITPPEVMEGLASKLPRATVQRIPDAGHLAPLEQPETVNAAIRAFLQGPGAISA